jgi:predicted nuclease of predicted toxin-antitoxin system
MKLLLDQGLLRSSVAGLTQLGIASDHVGDVGLAAASDIAILAHALQRDLVVVTLDADFHTILATSGATKPSVVRIRIEGLDGAQLARLLAQVCQTAATDLAAGAMVSVTAPNLIRVRSLPVA